MGDFFICENQINQFDQRSLFMLLDLLYKV